MQIQKQFELKASDVRQMKHKLVWYLWCWGIQCDRI